MEEEREDGKILCPNCNKNWIDSKYAMCLSCLKIIKEANQKYGGERQPQPTNLPSKELSAINNNLYAIRTQLSILTKAIVGKDIKWDTQESKFYEIEVSLSSMAGNQQAILDLQSKNEQLKKKEKVKTK